MYFKDIIKIVYLLRHNSEEDILGVLKYYFPECGNFEKEISKLKRAALNSENHILNTDYIIENNKVVIFDHLTGYKCPNTRWQDYIHEMLEVKSDVSINFPTLEFCSISQKSFFNLYKGIVGLTGTIGDKQDQDILINDYKLNLFKVPRNIYPEKPIYYHERPNNLFQLYLMLSMEIKKANEQGRPVLVIFRSINQVEEFCQFCCPDAGKIEGINPLADREAVAKAGHAGQVTVATYAAGRGTDIILDDVALAAGGLHVIVPMAMENERVLEQAIGRSGRQGQPGSASIYISKQDRYHQTPKFDPVAENLLMIQSKFSGYFKQNWGWLSEVDSNIELNDKGFPMGVSYSEVLDIMVQILSDKFSSIQKNEDKDQFAAAYKNMVLKSWAFFYCSLELEKDKFRDYADCEIAYNAFLEKLHEWLPGNCNSAELAFARMKDKLNKGIDWGKVAIITGVAVTAGVLVITFPAAAPAILIGGGMTLKGGLEIYDRLKNGEEIDWFTVLTEAIDGGFEGAKLSIALSTGGAMYLGLKTAGASALQNLVSRMMQGDLSMDALVNSAIHGGLEGLSVAALQGVCDKVARWMKPYVAPKITKLTQLAKSKKEVLAQGKVFRQLKNTKANLNIKARNFIDTIKKGSANKSLTRTETNTLITEILENPGQTAEVLQKRGILKSLSEEEVQMCKRFQVECKVAQEAVGVVETVENFGANNVAQFERLRSALASEEIINAERIGSGLKNDARHLSPSFLSKDQLANGRTFSIRGNDQIQRTLLQVKGELNGQQGVFEYILTPEGKISHQLFIPKGQITGYPNQKVVK